MMLVTGANGFVGEGVLKHLRERGMASRAATRQPKMDAIAVGDISAETDWTEALKGIDTVIHLAARVHVMADHAVDPLREFRAVNVQGTLNLAEQALRAGVRRFVFVSSVKVNGESTSPGHPFVADDTAQPLDPYGQSKFEAEQALWALMQRTGLEAVVIRPPLVYGPGVKANFRLMMEWVRRGVPLPLGAVHNRRSMIALPNLANLLVTCAQHPLAAGQVFLAADGADFSTSRLLVEIADAMGRSSRLIPIPESVLLAGAKVLGKASAARRLLGSLQVDIQKTRNLLNWQPLVSPSMGIKDTVDAFMKISQTSRHRGD